MSPPSVSADVSSVLATWMGKLTLAVRPLAFSTSVLRLQIMTTSVIEVVGVMIVWHYHIWPCCHWWGCSRVTSCCKPHRTWWMGPYPAGRGNKSGGCTIVANNCSSDYLQTSFFHWKGDSTSDLLWGKLLQGLDWEVRKEMFKIVQKRLSDCYLILYSDAFPVETGT